ncbi:hypothetical protein DPQ33_08515 [Oceanidesulfovibrio indonesiensis]|uniref:Uncharacterized protein n=1 Tax=Oceanidesulfovibrio indonesiensis TaxID=54767 RepID=A0A7M3MFZ3_9BACT|nr:hypothetical protein DPQ33_08515 [Oceanidesulfovibrio indonesiensis]
MLPIIVWFKKAISFDEVTLKLCRNNFCAFNTLPLSNAGFILSFYALVFSDCPCFSRYRYVIENTRISLDAKSFMFILLTSSAMHELFESDSTTMAKVIHDVKHSIRDIKETLHDVIQFSKSITEKDAMVNSLVSIFNLNMFAEMSLEQLIRDIRRNYFDGQPGTTPIRH